MERCGNSAKVNNTLLVTVGQAEERNGYSTKKHRPFFILKKCLGTRLGEGVLNCCVGGSGSWVLASVSDRVR